jgi:hypothetical protein
MEIILRIMQLVLYLTNYFARKVWEGKWDERLHLRF